jgi:hypothetical protein
LIDFRYHLISLIAVFLALGLGILMGSVVLSDRYVQRLEGRVEDFEGELDARREEVAELHDRVDALQAFGLESEPRLVEDALLGEELVAFNLYDSEGDVLEDIAATVESAGGTLVSTITLTDRFSSDEAEEWQEVASLLGTSSTDPDELRVAAASRLGQRAASAAGSRVVGGSPSSNAQRLDAFVQALEDEGYLGISTSAESPVPAGASFLVFGGAPEEAPEQAIEVGVALTEGLVVREQAVMVTEPTTSTWDFVRAVREHESLGAVVATVDNADTIPGRVAITLGLDLAIEGVLGHYGVSDGAASILPAAPTGA